MKRSLTIVVIKVKQKLITNKIIDILTEVKNIDDYISHDLTGRSKEKVEDCRNSSICSLYLILCNKSILVLKLFLL